MGTGGIGRARRVALVLGTRDFGEGFAELHSVLDELRMMKAVLAESADCVIHPRSVLNPTAQELRSAFEQALEGDGTPPDLLILYYSGHALDIGDGDLFIAAHRSSRRERASMLRADDLFALLLPDNRPRPREVVILLDTCHAGLAVARFRQQLGAQEAKGGRMPVLTVFGAVDRVHDALQLHFAESFAFAVRTVPAHETVEYVPMQDLCDELTARMSRLRGDQGRPPVPQFLGPAGRSRAFLNPWYLADTVRTPREADEGSGWAFCGRTAAADAVVSYLYGDEGAGGLAVTGGAGSGKSTLLDWIHTAAHGRPLPAGPGAPAPAAADPRLMLLDVRGLTVPVVAAQLAARCGLKVTPRGEPQPLLDALSRQPGPLRICFDSVDACTEPDRLYAELIAPLAALDHARVVVAGSRAPDGFTGTEIDIDKEYADRKGVTQFVEHVLRHRKNTTWAHADDGRIRRIARDTVEVTGHSWLRAYLFAVSLSSDDPTTAKVRDERAGVELLLEQLAGPDEGDKRWAREMLMPVALAQGEGLPADGRLWAAVVSTGGHCVEAADLTRVLQKASEFLAAPEGGMYGRGWRFERSPYARYLAESDDERAWHGRFVRAMTGQLPLRESGALDWTAADRYTREHFAHHAQLAGVLEQYLDDPEFLLMMNSEALHRALTVLHDGGRRIASLRTLCSDLARADRADEPAPSRDGRTDGHTLSRMALLAQVYGLPELARRAAELAVGWQPRLTYAEPTATVHGLPDGGVVLVDDQDRVRRTRGPADHAGWEEIALRLRDAPVTTTSLIEVAGRPALFAGQIDGTAWVQLLDRAEGGDHQAIDGLELNCRLVACVATPAGMLIAGTDGWQWRSDRRTGSPVRPPGLRLGGAAAALRESDGVAVVAARTAKDVTVWRADGTLEHTYEPPQKRSLTALAADATGVYTGAGDGSVYRTPWDDPGRHEPITGHAGQVVDLRVRQEADGPLLVSAGQRGDIRLTPLGPRRAAPCHLDLGLDVTSVDVDTQGRIVVAGTAGVIRIAR
jgi:hypothetical protein